MSAEGNWIFEGSLGVRFTEEHGHLLKHWAQPDRYQILENTQRERTQAENNRFLGGWKVASIPMLDWYRVVLPKYPELQSGDQELIKKAQIRFCNDPEMRPYLVKKA